MDTLKKAILYLSRYLHFCLLFFSFCITGLSCGIFFLLSADVLFLYFLACLVEWVYMFIVPENVFIPLSVLKDIFTGSVILSWHYSFITLKISFHCFWPLCFFWCKVSHNSECHALVYDNVFLFPSCFRDSLCIFGVQGCLGNCQVSFPLCCSCLWFAEHHPSMRQHRSSILESSWLLSLQILLLPPFLFFHFWLQ